MASGRRHVQGDAGEGAASFYRVRACESQVRAMMTAVCESGHADGRVTSSCLGRLEAPTALPSSSATRRNASTRSAARCGGHGGISCYVTVCPEFCRGVCVCAGLASRLTRGVTRACPAAACSDVQEAPRRSLRQEGAAKGSHICTTRRPARTRSWTAGSRREPLSHDEALQRRHEYANPRAPWGHCSARNRLVTRVFFIMPAARTRNFGARCGISGEWEKMAGWDMPCKAYPSLAQTRAALQIFACTQGTN
eukprot:366069-Chlamydomonas_euryale.AAC.16